MTQVEGCVGSVLSGEVFRVLLILMSHLSHTATTAVAEDNGEECNIDMAVDTTLDSLSPSLSPSRVAFDNSLLSSPSGHHEEHGGHYSEYTREYAASSGASLWLPPLLSRGCQATPIRIQ